MKVWHILEEVDEYKHITLEKGINWVEFTSQFKWERMLSTWILPKMHFVERTKDRKDSDFPYFSPGILVVSKKAKEFFEKEINDIVEFLPIDCLEEYYILNVLEVVDCFDYDNSEIRYYRSDPRKILDIKKFVFKEDKLKGISFFKTPESGRAMTFITDEFKEKLENSGLKGIQFIKLWDSENDN